MFNSKKIAALEKRVGELEGIVVNLSLYRTRRGEEVPLHDLLRDNFTRVETFIRHLGYGYSPEVTSISPAHWEKVKKDTK